LRLPDVFSISLIGNYLQKLTFVNLPRGEENAPNWQANLDLVWQRGPWAVRYDSDYFEEIARPS